MALVSYPGPLGGTRTDVPMTTRGKKFVSNASAGGLNVKVTVQEARVLKALGHILPTSPLISKATPLTGTTAGLPPIHIYGYGFGTQGANSQVTIGAVVQPIVSWSDEHVVVTGTRGAVVIGTPTAMTLRNQAMQTAACGNFTFTA